MVKRGTWFKVSGGNQGGIYLDKWVPFACLYCCKAQGLCLPELKTDASRVPHAETRLHQTNYQAPSMIRCQGAEMHRVWHAQHTS